jgi:hypothetical protein
MQILLTAITKYEYIYIFQLLLATPLTKWWPHLALWLVPSCDQTHYCHTL